MRPSRRRPPLLLGLVTSVVVTDPYPPTRRVDVVDVIHGTEVHDPYRWLEDAGSPEVQAWMDAQDEVTRARLAALPGRDPLVGRLRELFYYDSLGAPVHRLGRWFWSRKHADREKTIVYWRQGEDGAERVLLDPNAWSDDGSISLGGWWPSWDGRRVAYNVKENNADEASMRVIDVATGEVLADRIDGTNFSGASWTPDGGGFYYTWLPPIGGDVTVANRPGFAELRRHTLGTDPATDPTVFPATGNPKTFLGGGVSRDGRWLVASISHGWSRTDVHVRDVAAGGGWEPLVTGIDATYDVSVWDDRFYVVTNDGAPRYRIFAVDPARRDRDAWAEIVPEDPDGTITGLDLVGGHLVVSYLRRASSAIEIRTLDGAPVRTLALPGTGTTSGMSGLPDEDTGYFAFTSFTEPGIVYRTSIATGAIDEHSRIELPIDTAPYVTRQVTYPSRDGTAVTMFLIHHEDVVLDGANPTILYGYGGFNVSLTPAFSSARMVWLERGGVYAIANLRGGGEYGESWHQDGMLLKKQNVFDDFIAAARWLVDHGWTRPDRLAIAGGSNGGLLVGAAMTQAPELFGAVVCAVPLLDMIRFHLFGLGQAWVPEYGSADDPDQFAALYAYSPYHQVRRGARYPALLVLSADSDDRVDPMHARKFVAQIQWATSGAAPALIRIERNAGHGGADLVKQKIEETADTYLFLWDQLGGSASRGR
jgi:prolyl oligopeptidase